MKNLFTGVQVTFTEQIFDNSKHNQKFDHDGFRQHMLPAQETSIERVERELEGWLKCYGFKWENEFTSRSHGIVTMYMSGGRLPVSFKEWLGSCGLFASAIYGSVKQDGSFSASQAKSNQIEMVVDTKQVSTLVAEVEVPTTPEQTAMVNIQTLVTKYETYRLAARTYTERSGYTEVLLALTRENPVADLKNRVKNLGEYLFSTVYKMRLEIFEEALASLQPQPGSQVTTTEQADTLVEILGMTTQVEDYEQNEMGHVYTLVDGTALVVTAPTTYHFVLDGRPTS